MTKLIEIQDLTKKYGHKPVLDNINITMESGKIIGLLGPNGSGKSTLIKIMAGIINDYDGNVKIDGENPNAYTRSIISYLPEKTYLPSWMKVSDAFDLFSDFYSDFDNQKALNMLTRFNLEPSMKLKNMSKGMQEKVQLILVMSRKAKIYLLDEPLGGLDPASRKAMLDIILNNYNEDAIVLISTHLIYDVEKIFDKVIMIGNNSVIVNEDVDVLREKYNNSILELFEEVFKC